MASISASSPYRTGISRLWENASALALAQWDVLRRDKLGLASALILLLFIFLAVFGDAIAPYRPTAVNRNASGGLLYVQPPSAAHWLGTTVQGEDVFSQVLAGTHIAVVVGFFAALLVTSIGSFVGIVAGYYRGRVDDVLMRIVDVAYSIPFEPLAIVLLALVSRSFWSVILAISLLLWRAPARVVRGQVLSLSQRPFIKAARASGASDLRIILLHIWPNVLPIAFVYVVTSFGNAILAEAAVSFLGFGDPTAVSWGRMLNFAYQSGAIRQAWWWIVPPGLCITLLVGAVFFLTRAYDEVINPRLRAR